MSHDAVVQLHDVDKLYATDRGDVVGVCGIRLDFAAGERVAIIGGSGSGKTTLLSLIGCLDRPTRGRVRVCGVDTAQADDDQLAAVRNFGIGFVFQHYHLLRSCTVLQNVELPLLYRGLGASERRQRAEQALEQVGLAEFARRRPQQLSGGQQQRVAIARALVAEPAILLADEPTGNLDPDNAEMCLQLLLARTSAARTVVMVTHDPASARRCDRIVRLVDGRLVDDGHGRMAHVGLA